MSARSWHGGLGAWAGDGGGARGGRGAYGLPGRDAGGQGDGESADEGVACADRVDGLDFEAWDGVGAFRAG